MIDIRADAWKTVVNLLNLHSEMAHKFDFIYIEIKVRAGKLN